MEALGMSGRRFSRVFGLTGQTFRHPSSQGSDDTSLSHSPISLNNKRPDFIFLPASKQLYEDETASSVFGLRSLTNPSPSPTPSPCSSDRPLLGWSSNNSSSSTATSTAVGPPGGRETTLAPRQTHARSLHSYLVRFV
ncbi:hypothetical protein fugu_001879 [Takifugu bimaculatus]|uniref:Uncharacterized protein n=1 Tax=Takifugu bimaculatus TaxID=433685 RepID=A0A4Z2BN20_9TELE|nr:hypothetical protein fugu_001879 [Takifugu bimaculatus]